MTGVDNEPGLPYRERRTHIPLDDAGIYEKKALEAIIAVCTETLGNPAKVGGLVFGIVMENEEKLLTFPNGTKMGSSFALAGITTDQTQIITNMITRITAIHAAEPPEIV